MSEDELGSGLGGDTLKIGAIPGRDRRGKEARRVTKLGICVETDSEAICVVLASSCILFGRRQILVRYLDSMRQSDVPV